jgi:hypothetical protein
VFGVRQTVAEVLTTTYSGSRPDFRNANFYLTRSFASG